MTTQRIPRAKFSPGQLAVTNACMLAFHCSGDAIVPLLLRHCMGDFGDICAEDRKLNEEAMKRGLRITSIYTLSNGTKVKVLTESSRTSTTFMLDAEQ